MARLHIPDNRFETHLAAVALLNGDIVNACAKLLRERVENLLDHLGEAFAMHSVLPCEHK